MPRGKYPRDKHPLVYNTIWPCRKIGKYPNANVRCENESNLMLSVEPGDGSSWALRVPRELARLLARRINQCLDETRK